MNIFTRTDSNKTITHNYVRISGSCVWCVLGKTTERIATIIKCVCKSVVGVVCSKWECPRVWPELRSPVVCVCKCIKWKLNATQSMTPGGDCWFWRRGEQQSFFWVDFMIELSGSPFSNIFSQYLFPLYILPICLSEKVYY